MTLNQRKIILTIMTLLSFSPSSSIVSAAQPAPAPYVLVRQIPRPPLSIERCLSLLIKPLMLSTNLYDQWQSQYNIIMEQIAVYEGEGANSLFETQQTIDDLVDQLYLYYAEEEPDFLNFTLEDQLAIIQADSLYVEWQAYYNQQLADYYQLHHQAEEIVASMNQATYIAPTSTTDLTEETIDENQCQLYAYSMPQLSPDSILLDQHTADLGDYLNQVGDYLDKIVPPAYKMVTFQAIQDLFNRQDTLEDLDRQLASKQDMKIDAESLAQYAYEKTLSLAEVETFALIALREYHHHQEEAQLQVAYRTMINIKEQQFQYFYELNKPAFDRLAEMLASYLNDNQLTDQAAVDQVRKFQSEFQLKLVFLQEESDRWAPNPGADSGYRLEFAEMTPQQSEDESELDLAEIDQSETESEQEESHRSEEETNPSDNLAELKEKLNQQRQPIEKPTTNNTRNQLKSPPEHASNQTTKPKGLQLPATGESSIYTWIAVGLLTLGGLLLGINRWLHYKDKKKRQEIELD